MVLWLAGFPNSWSDCSHPGQAVESPFQHITQNAPFEYICKPWNRLALSQLRHQILHVSQSSLFLLTPHGLLSSPRFQSFSFTTRVWTGPNANWHRTGTQRTWIRRLSVPSHLLALLWPNHRTKHSQICSLISTDFCCSCQLSISKMASHSFLRIIFHAQFLEH